MNSITFLGTGTSTGIPTITCQCPVCTSSNPKNKRLRTSAFLETEQGKKILIDTSPDLREQILRFHIADVEAVIITHPHADHLHGIDDLRPFCFHPKGRAIPIYTDHETGQEIINRFPYIFQNQGRAIIGGGIPILHLKEVPLHQKTVIEGEEFTFFQLPHGHLKTMCFIHQKLAYVVDCETITPEALQLLQEAHLNLLVIDCLRYKPHQTHLSLEQAISFSQQIGAKQTGLIHFSHYLDHQEMLDTVTSKYPAIFPLYDGQQLSY